MIGAASEDRLPLLSPPTRLHGRERELEAIERMLLCPEVRLLTLTGPAGVGKTRLALEVGSNVASSFERIPVFVDLAPVRDPGRVLSIMVERLGLREAGGTIARLQLHTHLQDRAQMIILDNFEQLLPAAAELVDLLAACPGIKLLVTSRSPLQLKWERIMRVEPLLVPDLDSLPSPEELAEIPSVSLFLERARARQADFSLDEESAPMVAELCKRLDGLPLAIELAAARLNVLPLTTILLRLQDRVHQLHWDALDLPDRHRSLNTAIDWSYQLLGEDEQRVFRHLGVFVGHVSLDAISAVANSPDTNLTLERMASLAEKSLVLPGQPENDQGVLSFGLLETIREYARERLEREGELEAAESRHASYYLDLAERAAPELTGHQQHAWFVRLERGHDNVRAALRWLLDRGHPEDALRLAVAAGWFCWIRGHHSEGWHWLAEALRSAPGAQPALRTRALHLGGLMQMYRGDLLRSWEMLEEALSLARRHHDPLGIAESLTYLTGHAATSGHWTECERLGNEAVALWHQLEENGERGHDFHIGVVLGYLRAAVSARGEYERAVPLGLDSIARHEAGGDLRTASLSRFYLAPILYELNKRSQALEFMREGFRVSKIYRDRSLLSLGVEVTILLLGESVDREKHARLLDAQTALQQRIFSRVATLEHAWGSRVAAARERIRHASATGHGTGRALSFDETVELALELLEKSLHARPNPESAATGSGHASPLSTRELEVLRLVAGGFPDKQIGRNLAIAERTVRRHLTSILNKLGASNRAHAVAVASQRGLL